MSNDTLSILISYGNETAGLRYTRSFVESLTDGASDAEIVNGMRDNLEERIRDRADQKVGIPHGRQTYEDSRSYID